MTKTSHEVLESQIRKWQAYDAQKSQKKQSPVRVITISRQPGSGGSLIAAHVAHDLDLPLYHREITEWVAESAHMDEMVIETLDEKPHSIIEGWIAALTQQPHLWPEQYLYHLQKVIGGIASGDGGIVIGRGANFILPRMVCLRVRIVAPLEDRIENLVQVLEVSAKQAKDRILRREASRKAFIKHYFHEDIGSPEHYDMVLNTSHFTLDNAVEAIIAAWDSMRRGAL